MDGESSLSISDGLPGRSRHDTNRKLSFFKLRELVCGEFQVLREEIESACRKRTISRPRQVLMYLGYLHTGLSSVRIGHFLGRRRHATVLYGKKTIERMIADPEDKEGIRQKVERILSSYPRQEEPQS